MFVFLKKKFLKKSIYWIGKYCTRPVDQPMVKTTSSYLSYSSRKQINDGNSSASSPLMLKFGDMLKTSRFMVVEKIAIDDDDLNMTAMNLPVGSHAIDLGSPPIRR